MREHTEQRRVEHSQERALPGSAEVAGGVVAERRAVDPAQSAVVFLIGMRVNRWWMLPAIWAVAGAMTRMMRELLADPSAGLLHPEGDAGRTTPMVQYWRSLDDLQRYAHDRERAHAPAWQRWAKRLGLDGAVGIWHETYVVEPGQHESVYHHMPAFGLGRALGTVPAEGALRTARGRLAAGAKARVAAQAAVTGAAAAGEAQAA